ncbi:MAG TPA: hypothetical protein VJ914_31385 [Pseudonocardiaceae bacterium]|nr:hypothetical protein [Pseudonocardiaceae bacterium]
MDAFDEYRATVRKIFRKTREQQDVTLQELEEYLNIIDEISDTTTMLVGAVDRQTQLRTIRSRVVWSVAVVSTIMGVLAIWWASGRNVGFPHDLLEAIGAALVTFSLVEVFLHWLIGIPTKQARKQAKVVELVKTASRKMAELNKGPGVRKRIAEMKAIYAQLDGQIEVL